MDDRIDSVVCDKRGHKGLIPAIADDKRRALRNGPIEPGRQIVEHDDALAGVGEGMRHVAADVAGAAGDQNGHVGVRMSLVAYSKPAAIKDWLVLPTRKAGITIYRTAFGGVAGGRLLGGWP